MNILKKTLILSFILGLGILPASAKLAGGISKAHFYDTEKTIMSETAPTTELKTGKYWEKNLFYFGKYRPLFMLSNKELLNLMPREKDSYLQRATAPAIYSISLKNSSFKKISLSAPTQKSIAHKKEITVQKPDLSMINTYECAKNPDVDSEQKIDAAISLKNSKNPKNYNMAIDLLDDVVRTEPYNAYAYYLKGEIYSARKDNENAMKNYVEALKLNPTSKQSCLGIAKILEPTNKLLAQKYFERAK
jgi:tetratricopeptide (TPR) repeat protein